MNLSRRANNRKRAFADVITVEAWHGAFGAKGAKVDLHADVVFGTARLGAEEKSPVRFRLSVKRAEVVVVVPDTEPLAIPPKSVSRDGQNALGQLTEVIERSTHAGVKAKASGIISASRVSASIAAGADVGASTSSKKKVEISSTIQFMAVTQSQTVDGNYRWIVESQTGEPLSGRPWDGAATPRLSLIDRRKDPSKEIPPAVRVEVNCRREDLVIEDLEIKDEGLWEGVKARMGFTNRMAAATSYIRDCLLEEGLEVANIEDVFGAVTLASVTAETG